MVKAPATYVVRSLKGPLGFCVEDASGHVLADLRPPSIWSRNMEGTVGGERARIVSEGFWRPRYGVFVQNTRIGTITSGLWSGMRLSLAMKDAPPMELRFARSGLLRTSYQLKLAKDLALLELMPVFHWASFRTDLHVALKGPGIAAGQVALLLALAGFCARLLRSRGKAVAAAS
jgi:hypothetical protein